MATDVHNETPITPSTARRPASLGRTLAMAGVALFVAGLLALVAFQMRRNGPLAAGRVGEGERAPDFTLHTFDGQTINLANLRGQVVVVNFWASWCVPCEAEAVELENAWQQYRDRGVMFLGVDYVDTEREALAFLDEFGVTYPSGPDLRTEISHRFRVRQVPETFVVDQTGTLAAVFIGPTTQAQLQAAIEPLLAQ
jgi:cytochrome c biogenesis protein CcmG, thiol:disulfide interchange protein DsbE